jgi:hypothetical protein
MVGVSFVEDLVFQRLKQPEDRSKTQYDPGLVLAQRFHLDVVFRKRPWLFVAHRAEDKVLWPKGTRLTRLDLLLTSLFLSLLWLRILTRQGSNSMLPCSQILSLSCRWVTPAWTDALKASTLPPSRTSAEHRYCYWSLTTMPCQLFRVHAHISEVLWSHLQIQRRLTCRPRDHDVM